MRHIPTGLMVLSLLAAPRAADAFLLVSKSKKATSDGVSAVVLREGHAAVVSLEARWQGAPADVAIVVPVPASVGAVETLGHAPFDRLAEVSGPRLAEYWEQDPCEFHGAIPAPPDEGSAAPSLSAAPSSPPAAPPASAGAFEVQTVEAKSSAELLADLKRDGYSVPDGAGAVLDGYLASGMKLVVARLPAGKLREDHGTSITPVLSMQYASDELTLPTRLLAAGGGRRDLALYVLSQGKRFEASTQPNVAVPTNLDVKSGVRSSLAPFYGALLDRAVAKSPGAVITEYAWGASSCELCSAALTAGELASLGLARLPSAAEGKQHEVLVEAPELSAQPGGSDDLRARLVDCYGKALGGKRTLGGEVVLDVEVGPGGEVASAKPRGTPDEALARCAIDAVKGGKLDKKGAKGTLGVKFSPVARKFFSDFVLTRLRARYDAVPAKDLALVPARALEGGREDGPDGKVERRVYAPEAGYGNNFQARYAIRHPWTGAAACSSPERGVWGARPKNATADEAEPDAGKPDAKAGAPGDALDAWLAGDPPDYAAFAIQLGAEPPPAAPPPPSPPPAPRPAAGGGGWGAAPAPPPPPPGGGGAGPPCADRVGGGVGFGSGRVRPPRRRGGLRSVPRRPLEGGGLPARIARRGVRALGAPRAAAHPRGRSRLTPPEVAS